MKKILSTILALSLAFSAVACAGKKQPESMIDGSGSVEFSQSQSSSEVIDYPESPSAAPDVSKVPPSSSVVETSSSIVSESSVAPEVESVSSLVPEPEAEPEAEPEPEAEQAVSSKPDPKPSKPTSGEVRSIWITYLELNNILTGKTASQFRSNIANMFEESSDYGLNTVVVQVRPFGDAIYPSKIFPSSYLFNGKEGKVGEVPFDALEIMIEEADRFGLRIEAWINPYRVRNKPGNTMSSDNPARDMLDSGDAIEFDGTISYNPASEKAQDLIVDGVVEIMENYDIDAIHFDDYFYPTTSASFDKTSYNEYKNGGGTKALASWRRMNVTNLIRKVHDAMEATDDTVLFGISPQGNMNNNYDVQYVDIKEIVSAGLIDYLCPQMYFGFQNAICPYGATTKAFSDIVKGTDVKLYVGLATFKFGKEDTWAGAGKNEWKNTTDILAQQVEYARELAGYDGFVLYRYDSTFGPSTYYGNNAPTAQIKKELDHLQDIF